MWKDAIYIPTGKPFDYSTWDIDQNSLAEETARMTGVNVETAFTILMCELDWICANNPSSIYLDLLAKRIEAETGIDESIAYRILEAENEIYWKNGINYDPEEGEA